MSVQPASVITQASADSNVLLAYLLNSYDAGGAIKLDLRGHIFDIKRSELLKFPESILLGISNGLYFDEAYYPNNGDVGASIGDQWGGQEDGQGPKVASVNFPPKCFEYTLKEFRKAADDFHQISASSSGHHPGHHSGHRLGLIHHNADSTPTQEQFSPEEDVNDLGDMLRIYPAIIVLREDLDYYCMPTKPKMSLEEMNVIKRACGHKISAQNSIFNGLRKSDSPNSPERHLIDMLCSSGFTTQATWGFREQEPEKTVITSLALVRLKVDEAEKAASSTMTGVTDISTSHKLLLFWKKPARKCWWDTIYLEDVKGVDGPVRVHIRRVWTLELSVIDSN